MRKAKYVKSKDLNAIGRKGKRAPYYALCALLGALPLNAVADGATSGAGGNGLTFGVTLDGSYLTKDLALEEERGKGFGLGHSEFTVSGNVDDWFTATATATLGSHDGETEVGLEEAFIETLKLPGGLKIRAGRMLSQIGYLNGQHLHADDFATRPLLYRGLLGAHYFDDGFRLNWTLPTAIYARFGVEAFSGRGYIQESTNNPSIGVWTASLKFGADLGRSNSWQLGLATLRNRRIAVEEEEEDPGLVLGGEEDSHDAHDHAHAHGAQFTGGTMWIADAVWKWAPNGNNKNQQLRLHAEYARVTDITPESGSDERQEGWTVGIAYRFHPQWEVGLRHGNLKVSAAHDDHFDRGQISESSVMLTWKRSHFSALRLQATSQKDKGGFDEASNAVMLQYVISLGAHGAHSF